VSSDTQRKLLQELRRSLANSGRISIEEASHQPALIMQSAADDAADGAIIGAEVLGSRLHRLDYLA
jgi:hypothetical protein